MHIKLTKLLLITVAAAGCVPRLGNSSNAHAAGKYRPTWESLKKYEAPELYKDAGRQAWGLNIKQGGRFF
jgi:hypothetical protein